MADIFRLHVLAAEYGDCLWIEYGDAVAPHRVLVDAGTLNTFKRLEPLLDKVRGERPSHQLFVVSHIDADHIGGSLPLLESETLAGQFKEVWFNGRHHLMEASQEEAFGAVQGERLTAAILARKIPWNQRFGGRAVARGDGEKPVSMPLDGGAEITVLAPGMTQLRKLLPKWEKEIKKAGLDPAEPPVVRQATVGEEAFGALDVEKLVVKRTPEDTAEANGSSIACLIAVGTRKILLAADAHPAALIDGIQKYTGGKKLEVDVFKLPHHGSKANVTSELLALVDAKVIVFSSNGDRFRHPDPEAVARVIKRYGQGVKLVFNYHTQYNNIWTAKAIQEAWGYDIEFGAGEAGVSVDVHDL